MNTVANTTANTAKCTASIRRRIAIVASAVLLFGVAATACGEDVVDDDVEEKIDEADEDIKDFVDTAFTDTTGG